MSAAKEERHIASLTAQSYRQTWRLSASSALPPGALDEGPIPAKCRCKVPAFPRWLLAARHLSLSLSNAARHATSFC